MEFLGNDFLLHTETARHLYHDVAEKMPIVDYHCHLSPKEIWEDRRYENITQLWLGEDHYKWRLMRSCGIEEKYITGDAPDKEKFLKWAGALQKAIGNPLYHWSHLELRRYFGFGGHLTEKNAEDVWNLCNGILKNCSAREFIRQSGVKVVCTTDDPADTLEYHEKLANDPTLTFKVLPAWRPEKAMSPELPGYPEYLEKLGKAAGTEIRSFTDLVDALLVRMDYFEAHGCVESDHSLEYSMYRPADGDTLEKIFQNAREGILASREEARQFKTMLLLRLAEEYRKKGWVMQLHYGVQRNLNTRIYAAFGPDAGIDAISDYGSSAELAAFLDALDRKDALPKTVLYSLNPADNAAICTVIGAFQSSEHVAKIQQGSAWWFNDNKKGIEEQLTTLANLGYLPGFIGMLTDSRSFISYPRHEYFRRILCNLIGKWVEGGEFPDDRELLDQIIADICYNNAVRYFGFS